MAICSGCTRVKDLIGCPRNLVIGTITALSTAVTVYIERLTGTRVWEFPVTSSAAGLVTVDVGAITDVLAGDMSFNFWIVPTGGDMGNKYTVTLATTETDDCFVATFKKVWNYQGGIHKVNTQTFRA